MDTNNFKILFSTVAERNGFTSAFGGWFNESPECIVTLNLQKSNFGNYFELNLKVFVQGIFGAAHIMSKELVKTKTGDVFTRAPSQFRNALELEHRTDPFERERRLTILFSEFIVPLATGAQTRSGLLQLGKDGKVFLLPAIQDELRKAI